MPSVPRPRRGSTNGHQIKSVFGYDGKSPRPTSARYECACGWTSTIEAGEAGAVAEHAEQNLIDLQAARDETIRRMGPIYRSIFTHALGRDFSRITAHMTPEELSATVTVVLHEQDDEERRAAAEIFLAAVKRIVDEQAPPPEPPAAKPSRRAKPSSIAAFEAQWQAEHADDEVES